MKSREFAGIVYRSINIFVVISMLLVSSGVNAVYAVQVQKDTLDAGSPTATPTLSATYVPTSSPLPTFTETITPSATSTSSAFPTIPTIKPTGTASSTATWIATTSVWSGDASGTANPASITMDADNSETASFATVPPCTFSGTIDLQGRADNSGADFEVVGAGTGTYSAMTDASGHYELLVPADTYDVTAGMTRYLDGTHSALICPAGEVLALPPVTLLGGDSNGDCTVNILDLSFMGARFKASQGDADFDPAADINADGVINILDMAMAGGNFWKSCPVPWEEPAPACFALDVTASPSDGGTISADPAPDCENGTKYTAGTQVTLSASPGTGYDFTDWSGDASGSNNPLTVTMNAGKTLSANFAPICYTLTTFTNPAEGGTISADPAPDCENGTKYSHGTVVSLTANANAEYTFSGWSGGFSGIDNPISLTMDSDKNATAAFQATGAYPVEQFCGTIAADTTWNSHTIYRITCNSTIASGATLTIPSDVIVKFDAGRSLSVQGTLVVNGTLINQVYITSIKDDSVGGDTNNDGAASTPLAGDWDAIKLTGSGQVSLTYTNLFYGGQLNRYSATYPNGILYLSENSQATLDHVVISNSDHYGILLYPKYSTNSQALTIIDSIIENSRDHGVFFNTFSSDGVVNVSVSGSTIRNNGGRGIYMGGGITNVSDNVFANNNGGGLYVSSADGLTFSNNTFTDNQSFAAWLSFAGTFPTISNNVGSGNGYNGIVTSGYFSQSTTLPNSHPDFPLIIGGSWTIKPGATVTIPKGTIIKIFDNGNPPLVIEGLLSAEGAFTEPIYITSIKDDSVGGDTNNDGAASTPLAGDWDAIKLTGSGQVSLTYTNLFYGGQLNRYSATYPNGILYLSENSQATLDHVVISNSDHYGILLYPKYSTNSQALTIIDSIIENSRDHGVFFNTFSSDGVVNVSVSGSTIRNNGGSGIYMGGNTTGLVSNSYIYGNSEFGIYNGSRHMMSAENNWWGDASGPAPYGSGNGINYQKVYDNDCDCYIISQFYVDADPWLGQAANYGQSVSWQAYEAEPVNTATGNYAYQHTDLSIPTVAQPLAFSRAYNSAAPMDGPLGFGWTHAYNITATENNADHAVTIQHGDGRTERFIWDEGAGAYIPPAGTFSALEKVNGVFRLTLKDQTVYDFNSAGRLVSITDRNSNFTALTYADGLLTSVAAPDGRTLDFSYNAENRLAQVTDPLGRTLRYGYDGNGNLISYTDPSGAETTYTYDANHRLLTITDANGHTFVSNTYTDVGRVGQQSDALGNITTFVYDIENHKTVVTDPRGYATIYQYDAGLRLVSKTDGLGNTESYTYDADNNRTGYSDKNGGNWAYSYDGRGNLLSQTDPLGGTTRYTYDAKNNPLTASDPNSHTTTYTYDGNGNRLSATDPMGGVTSYSYTGRGLLATLTDPLGNTTLYSYNSQGDVISIIDPLGNAATYTYDAAGRRLSATDGRGFTTSYTYDALNRLLSGVDPLGGVTTHNYDAVGNLTSQTDPNGHTSSYSYDVKDQLVSQMDPAGYTTSYSYDAVGNQISVTDGNGNTTQFAYDALSRLVSETNSLGQTTTYTYDANGNRTGVTNPLGNTTTYTFDALNRQTQVTDPLGNTTTTTYDAGSNVISVQDANGNTTNYAYNANNQLVQVTDALGGVVAYAYDANGNRTAVQDANGHTTNYSYDAQNRLVTATDPLAHASNYTYDPNGNRLTATDANGDTTTFVYDSLNRLTQVVYADATSVNYSYDAVGNRLTMTDSTGITTYTYDNLDRPLSINSPQGLISYTYDALNRLSTTTPAGTITSTYDAANRLISVTDWNGNSTGYIYDAAGRQTDVNYPNGVTAAWTYDNADRITSVTYDKGGVLETINYNLDPVGNRLTMTDADGVTTYTYDVLNRLVSVTYPSGAPASVAYTYDPMGNRLTKTEDGIVTAYTYDAADRLLTVTTGGTPINYTWDNNGSLLTKGGETFTWDKAGRMTSWTDGTNSASYIYDGDGVRVSKTVNGTVTTYLQDRSTGLPVVLRETTGTNIADYVYGTDLVATVDSSNTTYYHADGLGSTRLLSDGSGAVTDRYSYDAFGATRTHTGSSAQSFTYTGEQVDAEHSLVYLRTRYYDAEVGRFISKDVFPGLARGTQTLNKYIYVGNNPTLFADPSGNFSLKQIGVGAFDMLSGAGTVGTSLMMGSLATGLCSTGVGCILGAPLGAYAANQAFVGGQKIGHGAFETGEGIVQSKDAPITSADEHSIDPLKNAAGTTGAKISSASGGDPAKGKKIGEATKTVFDLVASLAVGNIHGSKADTIAYTLWQQGAFSNTSNARLFTSLLVNPLTKGADELSKIIKILKLPSDFGIYSSPSGGGSCGAPPSSGK